MKKLKLPIIKNLVSKPRIFSMDDYYEFVRFNLENLVDIASYRKQKKSEMIKMPFKL